MRNFLDKLSHVVIELDDYAFNHLFSSPKSEWGNSVSLTLSGATPVEVNVSVNSMKVCKWTCGSSYESTANYPLLIRSCTILCFNSKFPSCRSLNWGRQVHRKWDCYFLNCPSGYLLFSHWKRNLLVSLDLRNSREKDCFSSSLMVKLFGFRFLFYQLPIAFHIINLRTYFLQKQDHA